MAANFNYSTADLVVYHGGCADGTAAAWALWSRFLNRDSNKLFYGQHGQANLPDVKDKIVVFVDFSYKIDVMKKLLSDAKHIRVLDHHESAKPLLTIDSSKFSIVLDMDRSGAQIAYDEANNLAANPVRPWFIDSIADRDLWRFALPNTKALTRAMLFLGFMKSVDAFDSITQSDPTYLLHIGDVLVKDEDERIDQTVSKAGQFLLVHPTNKNLQWKVCVARCEHNIASEVGNRLAKLGWCDFAMCYRYDVIEDKWYISCRAAETRPDIHLPNILKEFDPKSGGHVHAAGMELPGSRSLASYLTKI